MLSQIAQIVLKGRKALLHKEQGFGLRQKPKAQGLKVRKILWFSIDEAIGQAFLVQTFQEGHNHLRQQIL